MPFCSRCGTELGRKDRSCPACGKKEEKYGLYREAFRSKHLVYVVKCPSYGRSAAWNEDAQRRTNGNRTL